MSARCWCFTAWTLPKPDESAYRYVCWGEEVCPKTDRRHYQGFIILNRTSRIPALKRILGSGDGTHCETCRGTRAQAREYCRKDGQFVEFGVFEALTVTEIIRLPLDKIKEDYPLIFLRYHRGIEKLNANRGPSWREVSVTILWGPTGSNKTRTVMEMDDVYKIDPPYTWWDGYQGEAILLIDDFRTGAIPRGMLLNLLDGYRLRLETKGSHTWALWSAVYITTNFNPEMWDDAILRRTKKIVTCDGATR